MDAKTYLKVSAINLLFLIMGVVIGAAVITMADPVHAQDKKVDSAPPNPPACDETKYDCVSPGISTGTALFGVVVTNRIGADRLEVNGYEPLKLHDNTLKLLVRQGLATPADVQQVINESKATKPLRLKNTPQ